MPPTSVTENNVTVTASGANSSEAEVRSGAGFDPEPGTETPPTKTPTAPPTEPEPPEEPEPGDEPPQLDAAGQKRNADGTFGEKTKDPAGDPRRSIQAKINFERKLRAQAERERDELRMQIASGRPAPPEQREQAPPAPPRQPTARERYVADVKRYESDPDFPQLGDFEDGSFQDPYGAHKAAVDLFIHDRRSAEMQAWQGQQHAQDALAARVQQTNDAAATKFADWDDLLQSDVAKVKLPGEVLAEIYETEDPSISADLIHHLLTHPEECVRLTGINSLPKEVRPIAAAREVAKLTLIASSAPSGPASQSPSVTTAKPLIKPVKASPAAPAAKSVDDLPFAQLPAALARREREFREQRRGG